MRVHNFEELVEAVRLHLPEFLAQHHIDTSRHFRCIDPQHEDSHPSCILLPHRRLAYCHGCKQTFSIFRAAALLEGRPYAGPRFVADTLLPLAERFGLTVQLAAPTPEERYRLEVHRAYDDAGQVLLQQAWSPAATEEIARRGWQEEVLRQLGVGALAAPERFFHQLRTLGYGVELLQEIDLWPTGSSHPIFNAHSLIFTLHDEHGQTVGFAARNLRYTKEGRGSKYINTRTLPRYDICRKSERLYHLHLVPSTTEPLYVVEGYADVVSLVHAGLQQVVASGTAGLSEAQLDLLARRHLGPVILAFDGDPAGEEGVRRLVEKQLSQRRHLRIQVLSLPAGQDPDEVIRTGGREAFEALPLQELFSWYLERFSWDTAPEEVCEAVVPIIAQEDSPIRREGLARRLAARTGLTIQTILEEVERRRDIHRAEYLERLEALVETGLRSVKRTPATAELVLLQTLSQVQALNAERGYHLIGAEECLQALRDQAQREASRTSQTDTFRFGPDLAPLSAYLEGADLFTSWIVIGGSGNVGKTSLVCQLGAEMALYDNDLVVILHTIDDVRERIVTRLARHVLGPEAGNLPLNWLKHPQYYAQQDPALPEKHRLAYQRLAELVRQEKLIVKGLEVGTSLSSVDNLLKYYRQRHPSRRLVYILDNFHLLDRLDHADRDHERLAATARAFKRLTARYHCTGITTAEYTKLPPSVRPTNFHIYGSVQFEYEADIIIHLYNDLHGRGQEAELFHLAQDGRRLPTLELTFGKNKINDFKGVCYLDLFPSQGRCIWANWTDIERRRQRISRLRKPSEIEALINTLEAQRSASEGSHDQQAQKDRRQRTS